MTTIRLGFDHTMCVNSLQQLLGRGRNGMDNTIQFYDKEVLLEMLSNLAWKSKSEKLEREGFLYRIYTNGSHLLD